MENIFSRTESLLGEAGMQKLARSHVAVFGIGGVGGYAAEALARTGVGTLTLVDDDVVSPSNLNRQIIATRGTLGMPKAEAMRERILDINPACEVIARREFFLPENADRFDFSTYDFVLDAVDTVTAKIGIVLAAHAAGVPVVSAMGAGNKLDPTRFEAADLADTSVCPLARVMRRELRKRGVVHLRVVYSREEPRTPQGPDSPRGKGQAPGSVAFVPGVAGLILAGEAVRGLLSGTD